MQGFSHSAGSDDIRDALLAAAGEGFQKLVSEVGLGRAGLVPIASPVFRAIMPFRLGGTERKPNKTAQKPQESAQPRF
jgi:hypothetical protein